LTRTFSTVLPQLLTYPLPQAEPSAAGL